MTTKYSIGEEFILNARIGKIESSEILIGEKVKKEIIYTIQIVLGKDRFDEIRVRESVLDYLFNPTTETKE